MTESQDDRDVDAVIASMRSDLDRLEAAQKKDVADEDSEEAGENEPAPKTLREATIRVREHFRRARARAEKAESQQ